MHETLRARIPATLAALAVAGVMAVSAVAPATAQSVAETRPDSFADLAERLIDSVVNISTSQTVTTDRSIPMPQLPPGSPFQDFFDEFFNNQPNRGENRPNRPRRVNSLGSGFVIDAAEGIIITNNHVIADADELEVNFNDGTKLPAELIGRDPKVDIAVLKVDPDAKQLKEVPFANSDGLRVGEWVVAIGNPFGLGGTVTAGIVSAINRNINQGPYDNFIQTDASINRGNSGGPLFNMDGEVVGINTAIISPSGGSIGIGFAVPSATAVPVIAQLREFGETRRGWLGVQIQQVTDDLAEAVGLDAPRGALVANVTEGGPAEEAGIRSGDVILLFDGRRVPVMSDLPRMVADTPVGKAVDVVVLRDGEEVTLQVTLGRLEEGERLAQQQGGGDTMVEDPESAPVLGLTLAPMTDDLRAEYNIPDDVDGVVVTEVDPDSDAAEKAVAPGTVIVEVAQTEVATPEEVRDRVAELRDEGRKSALLLVSAGEGGLRFIALALE